VQVVAGDLAAVVAGFGGGGGFAVAGDFGGGGGFGGGGCDSQSTSYRNVAGGERLQAAAANAGLVRVLIRFLQTKNPALGHRQLLRLFPLPCHLKRRLLNKKHHYLNLTGRVNPPDHIERRIMRYDKNNFGC